MVRNYKKKLGGRTYQNYTTETLEMALSKIANGVMSIREASRQYKISFGTLYNKYKGKHIRKPGGQPILSELEENIIIEAIVKCGDWGFPLNMTDVRMFIKYYLERAGRIIPKLTNNLPGKDFVYLLLKRNKSVATQRLAANIKRARACLSRSVIEEYFRNLKITTENVPPTHIFNYDESNLADDPGKSKGIYRRGVKYPERIVNHSKSATSIMMCGSADGVLLPPYVIYKSDCLWDTWCQNGPKGGPCCEDPCCSRGTRYARTKHGWMDSQTFDDWYQTVFIPHAKRLPGKKVILGDNLSSHINMSVIKLSEENNIAFVCLPPNATHICQPLDVAFFRPLKIAWRKILLDWKMCHPKSGPVPKEAFPRLLKATLQVMNEDGNMRQNLISGFAATGIFPVDGNKVLSKIPRIEDPDDVNQRVNDSLRQYLQSQRTVRPSTSRVKRTKITVVPGKSITAPSSSDSDSDTDSPEYDDNTSGDAAISNESSSEESYAEIEVKSTDVVETSILSEPSTSKKVKESMSQITSPSVTETQQLPEIGWFVLVKFSSGRNKKKPYRYVCCIDEVLEGGGLTVHGLKSLNSKREFKLVENDVSEIAKTDIAKFLPKPTMKRGAENSIIYCFTNDIDIHEM